MVKKSLTELNKCYEQYRVMLDEERRSNDNEAAMRRLETKWGLDYWRQWQLKYRRKAKPDFLRQVRTAYLSTLEMSVRRNLERLKMEQAIMNDSSDFQGLIAEAEDILAKIKEKVAA